MFHKTFLILLFTFLFPKIYCNNQPSIVIIGAGASGIAAATRLLKNNFTNIKILEAEDRIGGRIHSVKFGDAYVDLGAEWCTDNEINIVYSLVKDLGILRATETKNLPVVAEGKHVDPNLIDQLIKFMVTVYKPGNRGPIIDKACKAENSYGKCFKKLFNSSFVSQYKNDNDIKMALASFTLLENLVTSIENALDWDDIAMYGTQYDENVQERRFNWNGLGFKTILDVLMQKYPTNQQALPIDEKLIFNKEVVSISNWKSKDKATKIKCRDGDIFTADHMLFTASLGVLKAKHDTLFDPALPLEKIDTIKNMGYGAIAKVAMRFAQRWWDEDSAFVIIWTPEDVEKLKQNFKRGVTKSGKQWLTYLTSILPAENNSKVMVAWYSRDIILELEQLSEEDLLEGHKYLIRQFLGKKYNVTDPDKILRSKWYTNPHFLGSYSYESTKGHATGGSDFQRKLAIPLFQQDGKPSILFAGEATNSKFFSTVHGAIETGYREADRVINLYKGLK